MSVNEREIVLDCLVEINEKGALSHLVLSDVLEKYDYLPQEKKAFIKRVTEGTTEKLLIIDEVIDRFSKVRTDKQKPIIRKFTAPVVPTPVYASFPINQETMAVSIML